jgi:5-methyltetrahydrofolate--homocysteine methyltransferase
MADMKAISEALQKGKAKDVVSMVKAALAEGVPAQTILDEGLIAAMAIVGDKFKKNEVYVPEVLIAARAMNQGTAELEVALAAAGIKPEHKMALGTVKGDLHDIGKNLVAMMFKGAGFEVIDLGIDVSPQKFVEAAKDPMVKLIGLSALLTTTMPSMKEVVELIRKENVDVKVIIGGAPVTEAYAKEIGADGYAADAASAVDIGKQVIGAA